MFARAISLSVLALPLLATALPGGYPPPPPPSCSASTGSLTCCNSVESASSASLILALLGIVVGTVEGLVGITCTPIVGDVSCTQQTVCCTDDNFQGLVALGCSPINV